MKKKEKTKKNGGEQPGVSWRFITATYIRGQKERLKKIKREGGRKNSDTRLYIYSRWHFYRDALSIRTHDASSRMQSTQAHSVHGSRWEKKVPGTPPSCRRKRYTFQTRITLFYARGVPTYIPIYLWTPLFYGKLSPVSCCTLRAAWRTETILVYAYIWWHLTVFGIERFEFCRERSTYCFSRYGGS